MFSVHSQAFLNRITVNYFFIQTDFDQLEASSMNRHVCFLLMCSFSKCYRRYIFGKDLSLEGITFDGTNKDSLINWRILKMILFMRSITFNCIFYTHLHRFPLPKDVFVVKWKNKNDCYFLGHIYYQTVFIFRRKTSFSPTSQNYSM